MLLAKTHHACEETENQDVYFLASLAKVQHVLLLSLEYCMDHWKEDWFFGYQCLNGSNPRMIKRCTKVPDNFPVTPDMVQSSMASRTNLLKELKVGRLLCDFAFFSFVANHLIVFTRLGISIF